MLFVLGVRSNLLKAVYLMREGERLLWDGIKYTNVHIIVISKGEEGKRLRDNFKEIMVKTFKNFQFFSFPSGILFCEL